MSVFFGGSGVTPSLKGQPSNRISLSASETFLLKPAGWYWVNLGLYTVLQQYDPIMGIWQTIGGGDPTGSPKYVYSDGVNYRLANQTGCAVGALITNAGSGYTSAPTVTASAGSSIWSAIVGGAVNTTVTVTSGGSGYSYPPTVQISAPPSGGIPATAVCTLSGGAVNAVTIVNQGAGYTSPPTVTFVNDPREGLNNVSQGSGAAAITTLTGAGTITGLLCLDHGTGAQTSIVTLSFPGGGGSSAAASGGRR